MSTDVLFSPARVCRSVEICRVQVRLPSSSFYVYNHTLDVAYNDLVAQSVSSHNNFFADDF